LIDIGVKVVEYDGIYFFRIGEEGYIKRLQRIPTEDGLIIRAKSENSTSYDTFDITKKMDFEVLGVILKVWCSTDY
jgi:phage repressor protein C with HTH and peptisase S24 domain